MDVTIDLGQPVGPCVIAVRGELDVHSASSLREALQCLLSTSGEDLVVDVSAVRIVDEAGRATIQGVARHCREYGGEVRLPVDPALQ